MVYLLALLITVGVIWFLVIKKPKKKNSGSRRAALKPEAEPLTSGQGEPEDARRFDFELAVGKGIATKVEQVEAASSEVVKQFKRQLFEMPALSEGCLRLIKAIEQRESAAQIAQMIRDETMLATEVLCRANELSEKDISDIEQAIVLLDYNALQGIVTHFFFSALKPNQDTAYKYSDLWKHAMATSAIATVVAKYIPGCDTAVAGTLGLLHDLGRIGINAIFTDSDLTAGSCEKGYLKYEHDVFGISHVEVGTLLAEYWQIPELIQQGIAYHHYPAFAEPDAIPEGIRKEVLAVYLADLLAIHFDMAGGHFRVALPDESYAPMLNTSLASIVDDKAIAKAITKALVRIRKLRI